jgi:cell division protein FtsI/penicillin-binding protein 2
MRRHLAVALAGVLCLLTGVTACSKDSGPTAALQAFLDGFTNENLDGVQLLDADGVPLTAAAVVEEIKVVTGSLLPSQAKFTIAGEPAVTDNDAEAKVAVDWRVADGVQWQYETTVRLKKQDDTWRVVWSPATVHRDLREGDFLAVRGIRPERGNILDGAGAPIVQARPVVVVGIEPQRITNQASLLAALDSAFKEADVTVDLSDLTERIAAAEPDAFVDVVTLRREVYETIRFKIRDLPGTVFQESMLQLAPTRTFARALLGTVGEVLKEQMDANPGKYVIGDQVGQFGLQEEYDDLLRGTSGVRVVIAGRKNAEGAPEAEPELYFIDPKNGQPLKITLDQTVQNAADAALVGQPNRSAIVAVRISDGAILAAANGPDGGDVNLAFTASVPPGCTFKMVTALGLLDANAVGLDTPVNCPQVYSVEGREFRNSNNFQLGTVPFRVDFAKSCNTAFASLAPKLGGDGLQKAAGSVGIGVPWALGTANFTGTVAANASAVEAAAAAFGQGTTVVSPLALAGATAAVARGSWQQPTLFAEPPAVAPAGQTPAATPPEPTPLNAASIDALRTMMREVVTAGTGTALGDVPGGPVFAKTGTAEFDNNPANTHAWMIGWQGDVAFAVFVEKGGTSTGTAVPIVETFLRGLA